MSVTQGKHIVIGQNNYRGLTDKVGRMATIENTEMRGSRTLYHVRSDDGATGILDPEQCRAAPLRLAASYTMRVKAAGGWEEAGTDPNPLALWHSLKGRPVNLEIMGDDGTVLTFGDLLDLSRVGISAVFQLRDDVKEISKMMRHLANWRAEAESRAAAGVAPEPAGINTVEPIEDSIARLERNIANHIELAQGTKDTLLQLSRPLASDPEAVLGTALGSLLPAIEAVAIPAIPSAESAPDADEAPSAAGPR